MNFELKSHNRRGRTPVGTAASIGSRRCAWRNSIRAPQKSLNFVTSAA